MSAYIGKKMPKWLMIGFLLPISSKTYVQQFQNSKHGFSDQWLLYVFSLRLKNYQEWLSLGSVDTTVVIILDPPYFQIIINQMH